MTVADEARAFVLLADYAAPDSTGKINLVGAAWQVTGIGQNGMTSPHAVVAFLEAPSRFVGEEASVSLTLNDESGTPVKLAGVTGDVQAMRVQQVVKFERPNVPGVLVQGKVWTRATVTLYFAAGLPLQPNHAYTWVLEIDGNHSPNWEAGFYVAGPMNPVIG